MNDIQRIAQHYGLFRQLEKLQEELDELWDQAENARCDINVTKDHILPKTLDALVDELADVSVMLQQIMYLTDTHDAVRERISFKVNRQLKRIAAEANNGCPIINTCHECYFCNIIPDKIVPYKKTFKCRYFNEILTTLKPCNCAVPKNRSNEDGKKRDRESVQELLADYESLPTCP